MLQLGFHRVCNSVVSCSMFVLICYYYSFILFTQLNSVVALGTSEHDTVDRHPRSTRPRCPKLNGLFPYGEDCTKYLNCANGLAYVQKCGPGTLFNPHISVCDWPQNVKCRKENSGKFTTTEKPKYFEISFPKTKDEKNEKTESSFEKFDDFGDTENYDNSEIKKDVPIVTSSLNPYSSKPECLKENGLFPYPKDCSKFVNCWHGRATVQPCSPGTLFDAASSHCVWPDDAVCSSRSVEEPIPAPSTESEVMSPVLPNPGQLFRLEGQGSPEVGYLQVFRNNSWIYVANEEDTWKYEDQICKSMGYERGAKSSSRGFVFGQPKFPMEKYLDCTNKEDLQCPVQGSSSIRQLFYGVVGLRCELSSRSQCPPNWVRWMDKCYFVGKDETLLKNQANRACREIGAQLVSVESQEKNDFLSNLLLSLSQTEPFHTNGIVRVRRNHLFIKWNRRKPVDFNDAFINGWPGWLNERPLSLKPHEIRSLDRSCIILKTKFPFASDSKHEFPTQYYYEKMEKCNQKLHYICEKEIIDIGCYHGNGQSYDGLANVTESGTMCLPWSDFPLTIKQGTLSPRGSYCANPTGDVSPWCFTGQGLSEQCDIPKCSKTETETTIEKTCPSGKIACASGECIYADWVCDGKQDCRSGEDEGSCPDYSEAFWSLNSYRMAGDGVEKWLRTTLKSCQMKCLESKNFFCVSFSYDEHNQICILSDKHAANSGGMVSSEAWTYFYRRDQHKDCSTSFVCSDFKCLSSNQVCDGHIDCPGAEDEQNCKEDFAVRLVGGSKAQGRVEARAYEMWGAICHDAWDLQDGHVVCKQLGFSKGAKEIHGNSRFGSGNLDFIMDDINCIGTEQSLAQCDFPGWGKHDCKTGQSASVTCYEEEETCADDHWTCDNGLCIPMKYYCDAVDDCRDGSDEKPEKCNAPVDIRLIDRNGRSATLDEESSVVQGRVEIFYRGRWGTVCDDDIGIAEGHVICRSMGFSRAEETYKNSAFGPGTGPIWMDGLDCFGGEKSLMKCHYKAPLGQSRCDHTEDLGVKCVNDTQPFVIPSPRSPEEKRAKSFQGFSDTCGIKYIDETPLNILASARVVDGILPRPGANPWMAAIRKKSSKDSIHWCGAAILSSNILLTAAHCVIQYTSGNYLIRTGDFNNEARDPYEEEWQIEDKVVHLDFNKNNLLFNNDIALVKLKKKNGKGITFNERVQPLCLPPRDFQYAPGMNCTVAGWGSTGSEGYSQVLLSAVIPIISESVCTAKHVYGTKLLSKGMFCAGYLEGGIDTCQGDSGGPLVCEVNGRYTAVGIISWGHGCARPNKPGVYTKLTHHLNWIRQNAYKLH